MMGCKTLLPSDWLRAQTQGSTQSRMNVCRRSLKKEQIPEGVSSGQSTV